MKRFFYLKLKHTRIRLRFKMGNKYENYGREVGICFEKQFKVEGYSPIERMRLMQRNLVFLIKLVNEIIEDSP